MSVMCFIFVGLVIWIFGPTKRKRTFGILHRTTHFLTEIDPLMLYSVLCGCFAALCGVTLRTKSTISNASGLGLALVCLGLATKRLVGGFCHIYITPQVPWGHSTATMPPPVTWAKSVEDCVDRGVGVAAKNKARCLFFDRRSCAATTRHQYNQIPHR